MAATADHKYTQLPISDVGDGLSELRDIPKGGIDEPVDSARDIVALKNDALIPITRVPSAYRDAHYAVIFISHFFVVSCLSLLEEKSLRQSFTTYGKVGSWASILMIVTLLGSVTGAAVTYLLIKSDTRQLILAAGAPFSTAVGVCLGNIILLTKSKFSAIGLIILLSTFIDSFWFRSIRENVNFTSALIDMILTVCQPYGVSLTVTCGVIVAAQTCVLLWWGVFFVGLIANASTGYAEFLILVMGFSMFWISQFFRAFMSFVIGGCVLWPFVRDERDSTNNPSMRVLLHVHCAVTTSLGSLCKGALFVGPSQVVLNFEFFLRSRPQSVFHYCCMRNIIISRLLDILVPYARCYTRTAYCLAATYGKTICKAALDGNAGHPHLDLLDATLEDTTAPTLCAVSAEVSGVLAILIGMMAGRREGGSWPMLFFVCFYLTFCGVSLCLTVFSAAADALFVVFAHTPEKFARENQIIFLRLLRTTESALR